MPVAGLEPARLLNRLILSQVRLPIPPHRHNLKTEIYFSIDFLILQVLFFFYRGTGKRQMHTLIKKEKQRSL